MKWHELMVPLYISIIILLIRELKAIRIPQDAMPYPQFFLQPVKQRVTRDTTTSIDCGAYGGIGRRAYTFYKGDTPQYSMMTRLKKVEATGSTGIASYVIPSVVSDDMGYYQCVVEDEAGAIIYSDVIYISVVDNYLTRVQAPTTSLLLLSTARLNVLSCTMPDSSPPALPRWFRDGNPISPDDSNMFVSFGLGTIEDVLINIGDLVMFGLTYRHTGFYTCAAYNYRLDESDRQIDVAYYNITVGTSGDVGEFTSMEAVVSDLTVSVGEEAYLFCGGIGNPAPDTEFLTITPPLEGVNKKTRLVTVSGSLTTEPADYYSTCRVGNTYYIAKLVIVEPPINSVDAVQFTDTSTSPIVYYDETDSPPLSLTCGTSAELAKQWFLNGEAWVKKDYHQVELSSGFVLKMNDVRPQDSGVYQCKAFGDEVAIYRTQVLCVVKKLSIETISPTLREYEGRSKKLTCSITGSPVPKMVWTRSYLELTDTENVKITHNSLNYPYTTTLEIYNVTLADTGLYECGARNYIPAYNGQPARNDSDSAAIDLVVVAPVSVTSPNTTVLSFAREPLVLQCTTYGKPKPSKPVWRHQENEIPEVAGEIEIVYIDEDQGYTSRLTVLHVTLANQGNYTCTSTNFVDVEETASVKISVPVISPIEVSLAGEVEIERGVVETITCNATGHPPAAGISWHFQNQLIRDDITTTFSDQTVSSVLTISVQGPEDGGYYRCTSNNTYQDLSYYDMREVKANFVSPVVISADARQMTGVHSKSLTLVCRVSGQPIPDEIRWQSVGYRLQDSRNIEISSIFEDNMLVSELEIKEVQYNNEREYNCSASNFYKGRNHDSSETIDVIVEYPIEVRTRSKYAYNTKGKTVNVVCEIEGKPLPDEILWSFSGNPGQAVGESEHYSIHIVSRDNFMNATLKINSLTTSLIGDYNCSASNVVDGVTYTSSKIINVAEVRRVIVTVQTAQKSVAKGEEANLTCSGEGVPPPHPNDIEWTFKGNIIPNYSLKYLMEISEERIYKINSVLRISDSQLLDEGSYTCRFSNRDKTNSSFEDMKTVQLKVQVPVEVNITSDVTLELYEGQQDSMTCHVFGKPPPYSVTWVRSKTGAVLTSDGTFNITTTNSSAGERLVSVLTINSMTLELEGTYECWAENLLSSGRVVQTPAFRSIVRVEDVRVVYKTRAVAGEVGYLARLVCSATGVQTPEDITWAYKGLKKNRPIYDSEHYLITQEKYFDNNRNMYVKVESTLTFKMVRWIDRGSYQCSSQNTNQNQTKTSNAETVLNVEQQVSINQDSAESLQTLLGSQVGILTVPLYGYPEPNVTWTKDGSPLLPSSYTTSYITVEEYSGVAQLTLHSVSFSHSGNYTLTAQNTVFNQTFSTSFLLSVEVLFAPTITTLPTYQVLEMTDPKIPCLVSSLPPASSIDWFYNGYNVQDLPPGKFSVEEMVVDRTGRMPVAHRNMVLKQARLADSGVYQCRAAVFIKGRLYQAEKSVNVSVVSAVVVTAADFNYNIKVGLEVNLTCYATGFPLPKNIIWYHNGSLIQTSNNVAIQQSKLSFKQRSSSLWIKSLNYDLYGDYECSSSNIVLGELKTDKSAISVFEELLESPVKSITSQELLIIVILAVIILIVVFVVIVLLVCRHRRKKRDREDYQKIRMETTAPHNGADSTLRADRQRGGLIQIDPSNADRPCKVVEYAELDPRVYKSDYNSKFKPMPRKKYASIDLSEVTARDTSRDVTSRDNSESRLI